MEFKDYYKVLGIERNAGRQAISRAFRKLARQYHPDVNPGNAEAETHFKEINEAYQVLNDPERRAKYDQLLDLRQRGGGWEELLRQQRSGAPGDGTYTVYTEGVNPEDLGQFSDFFQQLFGGLGGSPFGGRRRGRGAGGPHIEDLLQSHGRTAGGVGEATGDVEGEVEISLEEAFHGATRTVTVPGDERTKSRTIEVKIPRGVRNGQRIRAAGQGRGGDLYLVVRIRPHPAFRRQGDDVTCEIEVPVWTAALGGDARVPTLGDAMTMTIPAGTRDGRTFRLRGQGMPHVRGGGAGDELVKVRLVLPDPVTPRDRELFEEMRRLHETGSGTA